MLIAFIFGMLVFFGSAILQECDVIPSGGWYELIPIGGFIFPIVAAVVVGVTNAINVLFFGAKDDLKTMKTFNRFALWFGWKLVFIIPILWIMMLFGGMGLIWAFGGYFILKNMFKGIKLEVKEKTTVKKTYSRRTVEIEEVPESVMDARGALESLGYSKKEATKLTDGLEGTAPEIVTKAMRRFNRPGMN